MRILWVTPYLPRPVFGGGTRVFNLIRVLADSHDIDLLASADIPWDASEALASLRELCRTVEIVPPPASSLQRRRLIQLRGLTSRRSTHRWTYYSPRMQDCINRMVRDMRYDVAIVEHSFMGYYAIPHHQPLVLDQHNVESAILLRAARHERSLLRRAYNLLEYVKFRPDERRICRAADLILATSEHDRAAMERWPHVPPCVIIPNGVDTTAFAPMRHDPDSKNVVFTGSMHYSPNVEAMLYFTSEIWPRVRKRTPAATLTIVGGDPPPEIRQLDKLPDVSVLGYVPDMRPYIAQAAVVVAPLHIGGGTRLKIVEAMAMESAVVSTSVGCEGLEVQDGRHLVIADQPAEFADRVVALLDDPARRAELGREGRRLVETVYGWETIGMRLQTALQELVRPDMTTLDCRRS